MLELNKIYLGNCLDVMQDIDDKSVDMILCDLPYGTTACKWDSIIPFEPLWKEYKRIMKPNTAVVLFGTEPFASQLRLSNLKMFKYDWVWLKSKSGSAFTAHYRPVNKHEMIMVFGKGKTKYNPQLTEGEPYSRNNTRYKETRNNHAMGFKYTRTNNTGYRYPITVQYFQQKWRRQDQLHPTQKPVELCEYLIKTYSDEGDLVLDNCCGSGTTCIAAKNTRRNFIGIEKEQEYVEIAKQRLNV